MVTPFPSYNPPGPLWKPEDETYKVHQNPVFLFPDRKFNGIRVFFWLYFLKHTTMGEILKLDQKPLFIEACYLFFSLNTAFFVQLFLQNTPQNQRLLNLKPWIWKHIDVLYSWSIFKRFGLHFQTFYMTIGQLGDERLASCLKAKKLPSCFHRKNPCSDSFDF